MEGEWEWDPHMAVEHIQPVVCHLSNRLVTLLEGLPQQEGLEDCRLEVLDQLQLASPLHLKPLEG